jgi:hypothetical protein
MNKNGFSIPVLTNAEDTIGIKIPLYGLSWLVQIEQE